jgi:preprotein translocase subunit SecB
MKNIPEKDLAPLLLVECPRLIFPFARQVLATITQQGGFPPLMMEPVDFQAIYLQNLKSLQEAQAAQSNGGTPTPQVTN